MADNAYVKATVKRGNAKKMGKKPGVKKTSKRVGTGPSYKTTTKRG